MNQTTHPDLRSFVTVPPDSHFPIQNLPYGVFSRRGGDDARVGVAIGDHVLDLDALHRRGLIQPSTLDSDIFAQPSLNPFMTLGPKVWSETRASISRLLTQSEPTLRDDATLRAKALLPMSEVEMRMPVRIGDYTDFYSSREHAANVGAMFRGKGDALTPNYLWMPIAYHGRASSIVVSGTDLRRPRGQRKADSADKPICGPSRLVDFELEMGFFIGPGSELGRPVPVESAREHIFGMVLVNDWSARDIQKWEYVPLGPFLGKNFGSSISPWVVTMEAIEPFRCSGPKQDPEPLEYLRIPGDQAFDINLEVSLQGREMDCAEVICRSNHKHLYWSIPQQLAHHTIGGCNLNTGDLLASGTISGPTPESFGSLLELCWRGERPLEFAGGHERVFIRDYDRITMTGWCAGDGYRVGFGEVTGRILPANS